MYLSFYVIVIVKFDALTCRFVRNYMKMAQNVLKKVVGSFQTQHSELIGLNDD